MPQEPSLRINEIFHSIQGESTWSGLPCVFVRLSGCPLRCTYCDTEYAFREGSRKSVSALLEEVLESRVTAQEAESYSPVGRDRV